MDPHKKKQRTLDSFGITSSSPASVPPQKGHSLAGVEVVPSSSPMLETDNRMNTVERLLGTPFHARSLEEKLEIKRLGPDQPDLELTIKGKEGGRERSRSFRSSSWYGKAKWLCASIPRKKLFCFPCLLFSKENADPSWCTKGVDDLKHLSEKVKKHVSSSNHMECSVKLSVLGRINVATRLDSGYNLLIKQHNEKVDHNRHILSRIIDCIKCCGKFELALRGNDESQDSVNPGIFRGLVDLIASVDHALANHLKTATVFKGTSKYIQNDLLQCMLEVMREVIRAELATADFFAIISDDTTDVSNMCQNVLVFRYVRDGVVVERFYGFCNLRRSSAEGIANALFEQLDTVVPDESAKMKLIAQSYDGASVMSGHLSGVQKRVRDRYPNAHYVHCYAHQLNLIMKQAVSGIPGVRIFFCNLSGITGFFSHSPRRTAVLDEVVGRRLPRGSSVRWNFHERSVSIIYEHREDLVTCFSKILSSDFDDGTCREAAAYKQWLENREFVFYLYLFHAIMLCVKMLYSKLQKRQVDSVYIRQSIEQFKDSMQGIRDAVDEIEHEILDGLTVSRNATGIPQLIQASQEVCDIVIVTASDRFSFSQHLCSAKLLDTSRFAQYSKHFADDDLAATISSYPMLTKARLQTELKLIYKNSEFKGCSNALSFLKFFRDHNLEDVFEETNKLVKVLTTTPMTTSEAERCFSTLKRIKTFLRNTMAEERLNALAMISIEKRLMVSIPDFNSKVIEKFATIKERRAEFLYRQMQTD